jgi:lipoprotein NlpD
VIKPPAQPAPNAVTSGPPAEASEEGDWRPETYVVKRGDTLYSVALDHGLDYKDLAAWNQLADANVIKVGEQLRLRAPPGWKSDTPETDEVIARPLQAASPIELQVLEPPPAPKTQPKGIKVPYSDDAFAQLTRDPNAVPGAEAKATSPRSEPVALEMKPAEPKVVPRPAVDAKPSEPKAPEPKPAAVKVEPVAAKPSGNVIERLSEQTPQWVWPASGKLVHAFNQGSNPKGVAIRGTPGQPVFATAAGKVVYSGSGLRGYGKLIIIKHNSTYLSVYAHNRELLVKEGEQVTKGQKIAEMGGASVDGVALHFEIRRLGKPVDPLKFLPQEG